MTDGGVPCSPRLRRPASTRASGPCRLFFASAAFVVAFASPALQARERSTLIVNAIVVDGSGLPGQRQNVRIAGDHIVGIGDLKQEPGETVIDGEGRVLAPGFIDTHSHHDIGASDDPDAAVLLAQGVTTIILGQDGDASSPGGRAAPLREVIAGRGRHRFTVNYAYYAGHNTIRSRVMGKNWNRAATPREIAAMRRLLAEDMRAGAIGLSTGLEYDPGRAAAPEEVAALAREVATFGGRYASHMRNEDDNLFAAVDEVLAIGRDAKIPVHISHLKLGGVSVWGKSAELLAHLDRARAEGVDVSADVYPYDRWHTAIISLFPGRNYKDPAVTRYVLSNLVPPDGILVDEYSPDPTLQGKTLAEIAEARHADPADLLTSMIEASGGERSDLVVMGRSMREADVAALIAWSQSNICSDGALGDRHPRGAGSFARVLAHFVRDTGAISLSDAVRKMSGLAADHMGFTDRGYIRPGYKADLLLFDPRTIADKASFAEPTAPAVGVTNVWVNGAMVWNGKATHVRPGRFIARQASVPAN